MFTFSFHLFVNILNQKFILNFSRSQEERRHQSITSQMFKTWKPIEQTTMSTHITSVMMADFSLAALSTQHTACKSSKFPSQTLYWISPFLRYCKMYGNVFICTFAALSNLLLLLLLLWRLELSLHRAELLVFNFGKGWLKRFWLSHFAVQKCKNRFLSNSPWISCMQIGLWMREGGTKRWHEYGRESWEWRKTYYNLNLIKSIWRIDQKIRAVLWICQIECEWCYLEGNICHWAEAHPKPLKLSYQIM